MNVNDEHEQFVTAGRYLVIPRTLVFLRHGPDLLLLKGAPTKRLWAGRYNGLGGHVEAGETLISAALREIQEEAGIAPAAITDLTLRALINLAGTTNGVLLAVFLGWTTQRAVRGSAEGVPEWIPLSQLATIDLVDGDQLLPLLLATERLVFGVGTAAGIIFDESEIDG